MPANSLLAGLFGREYPVKLKACNHLENFASFSNFYFLLFLQVHVVSFGLQKLQVNGKGMSIPLFTPGAKI